MLKLLIEAGPLVVFFVANAQYGLMTATAVFMVATALALGWSWVTVRRVPVMPLVSGFFVLVFGGLTLALADELFIKMKPTIVNGLFATILIGGLLAGRSLLRPLMGEVLRLDDEGWRVLTWRWAGLFIVLGIANEVVWRLYSTDTWVSFKLFGVMPATFIFAMAQIRLIQRHQIVDDPSEAEKPAT